MYYYYMYGLYFESEILLYNSQILTISNCNDPDVRISISDHFIPEFEHQALNTFISDLKTWFKTDVGSFLIEDGCKIFASPADNATTTELSSYIIGWCMCYLFNQRNKIGIHCSALSYKNQAFLISGSSGAGKSTTALSLISRGYKYFTDDIAFVSADDGYIVRPALPFHKLCRDVADSLSSKDHLMYIDEKKDKYILIDIENLDQTPKKLTTLFYLTTSILPIVEHQMIRDINKVAFFLNSLFMASAFKAFGFPNKVKADCLSLASAVNVVFIKRPINIDTTDEICKIINKYLEEPCPL